MGESGSSPRQIDIRLRLVCGQEQRLTLREDSAELRELFAALAAGTPALVQLPLDGGRSALSVVPQHVVSVVTTPPVLVRVERPMPRTSPQPSPVSQAEPARLRRTPHVVVDDFLGVDENLDFLALALRDRAQFETGTVKGEKSAHRRNSVIMGFGDSAHATLLANRLLVWFPVIARALDVPMFPLSYVESQLTASNDRDYYREHMDVDPSDEAPVARALTCIYYFFREPKGYTGGELRLYDTIDVAGTIRRAESFEVIEPVNNRLVVFESGASHELMPVRCPSRELADSRFAVTTWLHRSGRDDPYATFGWGHFHCGTVADSLLAVERAG